MNNAFLLKCKYYSNGLFLGSCETFLGFKETSKFILNQYEIEIETNLKQIKWSNNSSQIQCNYVSQKSYVTSKYIFPVSTWSCRLPFGYGDQTNY